MVSFQHNVRGAGQSVPWAGLHHGGILACRQGATVSNRIRRSNGLSDVVADGLLQELGCENMVLAVLATGRSGNLSFSS